MSSGTFVKVERYYNHHHYHSIEEIDEKIVEATKEHEKIWGNIKSLVMATPKDITPDGQPPYEYLSQALYECREMLEDVECRLQALHDIKEGWETREED